MVVTLVMMSTLHVYGTRDEHAPARSLRTYPLCAQVFVPGISTGETPITLDVPWEGFTVNELVSMIHPDLVGEALVLFAGEDISTNPTQSLDELGIGPDATVEIRHRGDDERANAFENLRGQAGIGMYQSKEYNESQWAMYPRSAWMVRPDANRGIAGRTCCQGTHEVVQYRELVIDLNLDFGNNEKRQIAVFQSVRGDGAQNDPDIRDAYQFTVMFKDGSGEIVHVIACTPKNDLGLEWTDLMYVFDMPENLDVTQMVITEHIEGFFTQWTGHRGTVLLSPVVMVSSGKRIGSSIQMHEFELVGRVVRDLEHKHAK